MRPASLPRNPVTALTPTRVVTLLVLAVAGAYSVLFSAHLVSLFISQSAPPDWEQHRMAAQHIASGQSPYFIEEWYRFRWSPVAGWLLVPLTALGSWPWTVAQFGSLLLLPRPLALLTLISFPFWADIQAGNVMVFLFVAAFHALRGNRFASVTLLVMGLLVPRPLLAPLLLYIPLRQPGLRVPFIVLTVASLAGAVITGYHTDWAAMLLQTGTEEAHRFGAQLLPGWPLTGVVLAALLMWLGFPATAGLAVSPYWLVYYGLIPLADRWDRFVGKRDTSLM